MIINKNIERAFLVTDTHFGVNSNSIDTLNLMLNYFEYDFIPSVKNNLKDNDCLIHCGDVFDNRQNINLMVLSNVITLFEKLGALFKQGVYIIAGNHDILKKDSNEISSLDCLKHIPNVYIIKDIAELHTKYAKCLLMSWRKSKQDEKDVINNFKGDYIFCHADIQGCTFDKFREVEHGIEFDDIKNVKRLFSGHIHWQQIKKNVNLLGTPYEITRSDANNNKGFWLYDFEFEEEIFFENNYSPKFKKFNLSYILAKGIENIKDFKNNRVDIYVDESLLTYNIKPIVEEIKKLAYTVNIFKANEIKQIENTNGEHLELFDVVDMYLNNKDYNQLVKNNLKSKFISDYKIYENS